MTFSSVFWDGYPLCSPFAGCPVLSGIVSASCQQSASSLSPRGTALCWVCDTGATSGAGRVELACSPGLGFQHCSFAFCWCLVSVGKPRVLFLGAVGAAVGTQGAQPGAHSTFSKPQHAVTWWHSGLMGHSSVSHLCILFDSPWVGDWLGDPSERLIGFHFWVVLDTYNLLTFNT